jgi:hypothetical protein
MPLTAPIRRNSAMHEPCQAASPRSLAMPAGPRPIHALSLSTYPRRECPNEKALAKCRRRGHPSQSRHRCRHSGQSPLLKTPPPVIYTWTGCYLGGNAGWFGASQTAETVPLNNDGIFGETTTSHDLGGNGAIGGAYAGRNWQTGQMVVGGEGDLEFLRRNNSNTQFSSETPGAPPGIPNYVATSSASNNWLGSLRGRVGFTTGQWLLYATGGAAWTRTSHAVLVTGIPTAAQVPIRTSLPLRSVPTSPVSRLAPEWKGCWRRTGRSAWNTFVGNWSNLSINTVTVGVSNKFGAPVVAAY